MLRSNIIDAVKFRGRPDSQISGVGYVKKPTV